MANRKLYTRFRLVPKLTTLDDLERPLRILFQNTRVFGAHHENLQKKIDAYYQRRRCSPMQYKVYADIRGVFLETGRQRIVSLSSLSSRFTYLLIRTAP